MPRKPLNKEVVEQWLERLESGRYPEGGYCLKAKWGYSPLGVLAQIWLDEHLRNWSTAPDPWMSGLSTSIPTEALIWAGIPLEVGVQVAIRNDKHQWSFAMLVPFIRASLKMKARA